MSGEESEMTAVEVSEIVERTGTIPVPGGNVWYRIVGEGDATPLLTLHGGPGVPSAYLATLAGLADERPVIFFDQLGCGNSDRPDDPALWTTERSVAEVQAVVAALGLTRFHLLGQSWGTMLAVDYLLTRPDGVVSVTLASPALSIPRWTADARTFVQAMPEDVRATIVAHEAAGTTDSPEYLAAIDAYYRRHVCRMDPWPDPMTSALATMSRDVYQTMWGPSEFCATGSLRDYDRTDRLGELDMPALFTCGRFDEATPEATAWYASLVPGARIVIFEDSSHVAHLEEETAYLDALRAFLRQADARA